MLREPVAADETRLKQSRNPIALNRVVFHGDQLAKREMTMIQIGSKEEVALLLALFGTHTQAQKPAKAPKGRRA